MRVLEKGNDNTEGLAYTALLGTVWSVERCVGAVLECGAVCWGRTGVWSGVLGPYWSVERCVGALLECGAVCWGLTGVWSGVLGPYRGWVSALTLCRSNLNPYCLGRKTAFFFSGHLNVRNCQYALVR
jgi:hypothetical protein